ncbi:protein translocase subunit SecD [Brevibacterium sp. FME17]|uniref:protein translocase subunit SecD n=1 Tax=Brevibacterium sp. FME17 TaxID=2742606 RepID=UPI00299F8AFF|nr:protein translocase subunit SecD [Brevibacterium sp. FME17]
MSDIEEKPRPGLRFVWLSIIAALLLAIIAGGVVWSDATTTPKLALDLEGGTSIILEPQVSKDTDISKEQLDQAVSIIRQRVDSTGVSEAEITTQGDRNIVVNLPGNPDEETRNLVRSSAQLVFRRVALVGDPRSQEEIQKEQEKSGGDKQEDPSKGLSDEEKKRLKDLTGGSGEDKGDAPAGGGEVSKASGDDANAGGKIPGPAGKDAAKSGENSGDKATEKNGSGDSEDTKVTDSTPRPLFDPEKDTDKWQTDAIIKKYTELDCTDPKNRTGGQQQASDKPVVACAKDGKSKYILGPVELSGDHLADASFGYKAGANGTQTNQPAVNLKFDSTGREIFKQITSDITGKQQPYNQFAIELDGNVLSAPSSDAAITDGNAEISGSFTLDSAQTLADQLKNGSLPLSFQVQSEDQISPTLGSNYLKIGLLTGLLGLILVVVYSLLQYRVLGLVTVSSLVVVGVVTYLLLLLASWRYGYRLSLAGLAGIIIGIGMAADSFIVYFERVRDELRSGRVLLSAVEVGWDRAKRTIYASKAVNMLAAVILYILAVGSVRGFAFTFGMAVIVDVVVVFLFTHPMLQLLARTKFFGEGHPMSGMDPRLLGVSPASYRGALNLSKDSEMSPEARRRAKARARKAGISSTDEADSSRADSATSATNAKNEVGATVESSTVSKTKTSTKKKRGTSPNDDVAETVTSEDREVSVERSDQEDVTATGSSSKSEKPTKKNGSKGKISTSTKAGATGGSIAERKAAAKKAAEESADKGEEADK